MTRTSAATRHAGAGVPVAGRYRLDPARSSFTFRTRHLFGLGRVSGTMAVAGGEITIDPAVPQPTVTATVSAASFTPAAAPVTGTSARRGSWTPGSTRYHLPGRDPQPRPGPLNAGRRADRP
jgi:polyisoprenoid-binding protein YceI